MINRNTMTTNGIVLNSTRVGIENRGTTTLKNSEVTTTGSSVTTYGTITIDNSNVKSTGATTISGDGLSIIVESGNVISENGNAMFLNNDGAILIKNGKVESKTTSAITRSCSRNCGILISLTVGEILGIDKKIVMKKYDEYKIIANFD